MFSYTRICLVVAALFPVAFSVSAQQTSPATQPASRSVRLAVSVEPKFGEPVIGLQQSDFSVTDNKVPRTLTSFNAISAEQEPVKIILVIDAVNIGFSRVAYARGQAEKFLHANGGQLPFPTSVAVLTESGTEIQKTFSTDGNALSDAIDHYTIGLREITRDTGIWGANDRLQISLTAISQLTSYAATIPGRKIVLWISPGWALLSGPHIDLDSKQRKQIFENIVAFSSQMRQANMTLYNINPLGPSEGISREDEYQGFVKGVPNPNQVYLADLSLQVLAIQSGGLALIGSNDVAGLLAKSAADTKSWYEITFDAPPAELPNEYHHIEVKVNKPGLTARTRDGYYAQP